MSIRKSIYVENPAGQKLVWFHSTIKQSTLNECMWTSSAPLCLKMELLHHVSDRPHTWPLTQWVMSPGGKSLFHCECKNMTHTYWLEELHQLFTRSCSMMSNVSMLSSSTPEVESVRNVGKWDPLFPYMYAMVNLLAVWKKKIVNV